jgi:ankyrin repeat protein
MDIFEYCKTGNLETLRQLLENGTDINVNEVSRYGWTALHEASNCEQFAVVQVLIVI